MMLAYLISRTVRGQEAMIWLGEKLLRAWRGVSYVIIKR